MSSKAASHTGEVRAGRFDPEVFVNCNCNNGCVHLGNLQNNLEYHMTCNVSC